MFLMLVEQITWVFDDIKGYFSTVLQKICCGYSIESIRRGDSMSTHNICLYGELSQIIT